MQRRNDAIVLSASDLMWFQGCAHATALDLRLLNGEHLTPAEDSATAKLIQAKGHKHEAVFLASLKSTGKSILTIDKDALSIDDALRATRRALSAGLDYIYQAALSSDLLDRLR